MSKAIRWEDYEAVVAERDKLRARVKLLEVAYCNLCREHAGINACMSTKPEPSCLGWSHSRENQEGFTFAEIVQYARDYGLTDKDQDDE